MARNKKSIHPLRPSEARDIQDEIFRKMPLNKKIKLASELTMFCLKLHKVGLIDKDTRVILK